MKHLCDRCILNEQECIVVYGTICIIERTRIYYDLWNYMYIERTRIYYDLWNYMYIERTRIYYDLWNYMYIERTRIYYDLQMYGTICILNEQECVMIYGTKLEHRLLGERYRITCLLF
jgi:hypothetical protein